MDRNDFFEKWGILANDHNEYSSEYRDRIKQKFMEALDEMIIIEDQNKMEKEIHERYPEEEVPQKAYTMTVAEANEIIKSVRFGRGAVK